MPTVAIIGAQWGDEGKGKITDYLAEGADAVVRFQGGNNAGHTIVIGDSVFKLHMLPSGILRDGKLAVIGNGVVVNIEEMEQEIQQIEDAGLSIDGLRILTVQRKRTEVTNPSEPQRKVSAPHIRIRSQDTVSVPEICWNLI